VKRLAEWDKLIPRPKTKFLSVKCPKCENEQIIFSSSATLVHCNKCGELLVEPSGGKPIIKGEIVGEFE